MIRLIKQTSKSFMKKIALTSTFVLAVFIMVFLGSSATSLVFAIDNSYKKVQRQGNSAQLASSISPDVTDIVYDIATPQTNVNWNIKDPIKAEVVEIMSFGSADLSFDTITSNLQNKKPLQSYQLGGNYVLFPYGKSDFISQKKAPGLFGSVYKDINYNKPETWNDKLPESIWVDARTKLKQADVKFPYIRAMSFVDAQGNKLSDIRNILIKEVPNKKNPNQPSYEITGYWNDNGDISQNIRMLGLTAAYNDFNKPNFNPTEIEKGSLKHEDQNQLRIYQFDDQPGAYSLTAPDDSKYMHRIHPNNSVRRNLENVPVIADTAQKPNTGLYKQKTKGYRFKFNIKDHDNIQIKNFFDFLTKRQTQLDQYSDEYQEIESILNPYLDLTYFQTYGMTKENFDKLPQQQKDDIYKDLDLKLVTHQQNLSNKVNSYYWRYASSHFANFLTDNNFDYDNGYSMYYQDPSKNQFLYVQKDSSSLNQIVIDHGKDINKSTELNPLIKIANYLQQSPNDIEFLKRFLEIILRPDFEFRNDIEIKITKNLSVPKTKDIAQKLYVDIKERTDIQTFEQLNRDPKYQNKINPHWYLFSLKFNIGRKTELIKHIRNSKDFNVTYDNGSGLISSWTSSSIYKDILMNNFVILNTPYYLENKKRSIPETTYFDAETNQYIYSLEDLQNLVNKPVQDKNNWNIQHYINNLPEQYTIKHAQETFLIAGAGVSPDYAFPLISLQNPIPDPSKEGVVYINEQIRKFLESTTGSQSSSTIQISFDKGNLQDQINFINQAQIEMFGLPVYEIYSADSATTNFSINTLRESVPKMIKDIFLISISIVLVFLSIIIMYVLYLLLKIILSELSSPFAIARANGVANWKIYLSVLIPTMGITYLVSIAAFIGSHFLKLTTNQLISSIWFLPMAASSFSFGMLFAIFGILGITISFFVWYLLQKEAKKPVLSIINNEENIKNNRMIGMLRANNMMIAPIWKLRGGFFLTNISKILVLTLLVSATFSLSSSAIIFSNKINVAQMSDYSTKKYNYAFDLQTPTEATGLYKVQSYADIGIADPIKNIESSINNPNDPYYKLIQNGQSNLLALRNDIGELILFDKFNNPVGTISDANVKNVNQLAIPQGQYLRYYSNYLLPSYVIYNQLKTDMNFLFNATMSVFLLDISLSSAIPGIPLEGSAWDFVKSFVPQEFAFKLQNNLHDFKQLLLETRGGYKVVNDPTTPTKKIIQDGMGNAPDIYDFVYYLDHQKLIKDNEISIDFKKTVDLNLVGLDLNKIRLKDDYMKFLGTVFSNPLLTAADSKISAGVIPYDKEFNETYTYANGAMIIEPTILDPNPQDQKIKLLGIKQDSKFIDLKNSSGENLNDLLINNHVVINEGAAIDYDLDVDSTFKVKFSDSYYSSSRKIAAELSTKYKAPIKEIEFKVVGISTDSIGSTFYINQDMANDILDLNHGAFNKKFRNPALLNNQYNPKSIATSPYEKTTLDQYKKLSQENSEYMPFNGMFSSAEIPKIFNSAIILFSNSGFYSSSFDLKDAMNFKKYFKLDEIINTFNTTDQTILSQLKYKDGKAFMDALKQTYSSDASITSIISKIYDGSNISIAMKIPESKELTRNLFDVSNGIISSSTIIILAVFVTILIATMLVVVLALVTDLKRILADIKLLGYSDGKVLRTVLYTLLPVVIFSLLIGTGMTVLTLLIGQQILYSITNVVITNSLNLLVYGGSIVILLLLIVFCSLVSIRSLKKQKLTTASKK